MDNSEAEPMKAVWEGSFTIGGHILRCYVLEDGTRIIDADDLDKFFLKGSTIEHDDPGITELAKWSKGL
jgi:hypothetical protein